jgi:sulfite exporter TauE/SafE
MNAELLSVFLVGLLGGVHCAGMCGGLISALSLHRRAKPIPIRVIGNTPPAAQPNSLQAAARLLCYNLGRIGSYTIAGAIVGGFGSLALLMQQILPLQQAAFIFANLMLIGLGLYLSGLWRGVSVLERLGYHLWKPLQALTRHLLPIDTLGRALAAGALWGWVPCGMVYSVLVIALVSGSAGSGALLMLAFGLGTLPNLLLLGSTAAWAQRCLQRPALRVTAGALVAAFGILGLLRLNPLTHLPTLSSWCRTLI